MFFKQSFTECIAEPTAGSEQEIKVLMNWILLIHKAFSHLVLSNLHSSRIYLNVHYTILIHQKPLKIHKKFFLKSSFFIHAFNQKRKENLVEQKKFNTHKKNILPTKPHVSCSKQFYN